jgi:tRNA (cmo5U34)-methyltransferase
MKDIPSREKNKNDSNNSINHYSDSSSEWSSAEYALEYLEIAEKIPHKNEGEKVLLEYIPAYAKRILDLGTGDGRLIKLIKSKKQHNSVPPNHGNQTQITAVDVSPTMLERVRNYFNHDNDVRIIEHDLSYPISSKLITDKDGQREAQFGAIISSLAIHHLAHDRKYSLYKEVYGLLKPGGVFCNLDHVASPTPSLHRQFLAKTACKKEDKSNKLLDVQTQLKWLQEIGFIDVDCYWNGLNWHF